MKFDNNDTCVLNDSYVCIILIDSSIAPKSLSHTNKTIPPADEGRSDCVTSVHNSFTNVAQQGEIIESSLK